MPNASQRIGKRGQFKRYTTIISVILVILVILLYQIFSHIRHLYGVVLEQEQDIERLLQAENQRLWNESAQEERPALVFLVIFTAENSTPEPINFVPLDIALPEDLQLHTWELCGTYETPLSQQEFFELMIRVMWMESRHLADVPDNINKDGSIDRGPMQINSCNWEWLAGEGLDVSDPKDNIESGVLMLSALLNKHPEEHALTAYNHGETAAEERDGKSDFADVVMSLKIEDMERK